VAVRRYHYAPLVRASSYGFTLVGPHGNAGRAHSFHDNCRGNALQINARFLIMSDNPMAKNGAVRPVDRSEWSHVHAGQAMPTMVGHLHRLPRRSSTLIAAESFSSSCGDVGGITRSCRLADRCLREAVGDRLAQHWSARTTLSPANAMRGIRRLSPSTDGA